MKVLPQEYWDRRYNTGFRMKGFAMFTFHNVLRGMSCWIGHVTLLGEMRDSYEALVRNREGKRGHVTFGAWFEFVPSI